MALNYNNYAERVKTEIYFFSIYFLGAWFGWSMQSAIEFEFWRIESFENAHTIYTYRELYIERERHDEQCKLMNGENNAKTCKYLLCLQLNIISCYVTPIAFMHMHTTHK